MELSEADIRRYMERCIELAKRAPSNLMKPHVGALVLSAKGQLAGEGHGKLLYGTAMKIHAERVALDEAETCSAGGTLFTTLEPCVVTDGKKFAFDSCSELIVRRCIRKVFYALTDNSIFVNSEAPLLFLHWLKEPMHRHNVY